jgi:hypothetical protein
LGNSDLSLIGTGAAVSSPPPPASQDESAPQGGSDMELYFIDTGSTMKRVSSAFTNG